MPELKIDSVVSDLREEEKRLKKALAELRSSFKRSERELSEELRRVQAGLGALNAKGGAKKAPKQRRPDPAVLAALAAGVLEGSGVLTEEELAARVEERLAAAGKPRAGVRPALRKALDQPRFHRGAEGWSLAAPSRVPDPDFQPVGGPS